jgi:hypothetical protein
MTGIASASLQSSISHVPFNETVVLAAPHSNSGKAVSRDKMRDKVMIDLERGPAFMRNAPSTFLSQPPFLDFFQGPSLGFRNAPPDKEERGGRDRCIEQKNARSGK